MVLAFQICQLLFDFLFGCLCGICPDNKTVLLIRAQDFLLQPLAETFFVLCGKLSGQAELFISCCKDKIFSCEIQV